MRPLRFCMLTTFYPPAGFGGDAIQVARLAAALAERGHEVTVVHSPEAYRTLAPRSAARAGGRGGPEHAEHPGVRVVPIDTGTGPLSPLSTYLTGRPLLARRRLERALSEPFDVLHFHNPSLLGGASLLGMGTGLRLYTAHEQWLVCPTHVLWKYHRRVCEKPQCWRCSATYRRPPQIWRSTGLLERSVSRLDALIAPSRTTARLHARFAPLVAIEHLPHFVPDAVAPTGIVTPDDGDPAPLPSDDGSSADPPRSPPGERPFFLFAGRLESIKGVGTLLDAFRRRRSEDLLIAGTGALEPRLRRAAADLPHVRFLGWVPTAKLDLLYRRALAVLVPTIGHESFGLVPVEAFARGTPAIVHGFGALAELATDSGAAIEYGSGEELDAAIGRIAGDAALRQELSSRARAAYLRSWTPEAHLSGYLRLIARRARERGDPELARAADDAAPAGTGAGTGARE